MPVASSEIIEDAAQADGRRYIRERHVDHAGREHFATFLADAEYDAAAGLVASAERLSAQLRSQETQAVIQHCLSGQSIELFPFADLTISEGAAAVLRHVSALNDPRPAKAYADRVVDAGAGKVALLLGISQEAATGVMEWAQGVLDSLAAQDAARSKADAALAEVGA